MRLIVTSGVTIISCALLADSFLGNLQERTMQTYDVSSREMVYYSHVIGSGYLLAISVLVGQFGEAFAYCYEYALLCKPPPTKRILI